MARSYFLARRSAAAISSASPSSLLSTQVGTGWSPHSATQISPA